MTVLVTGVAGFIGAAVTRALLERGEAVVGVDNLNDYYEVSLKRARLDAISTSSGFAFLQSDFSDSTALAAALAGHEFDKIIHLGAQAGVRYSLVNPQAYATSNLVGHLNLLEVARSRGVAHFVYASSSSVYGSNAKLPFSVKDPVDAPLSLYAATKKADELMSHAYAHLYRIPSTGLRFFTVYGPWGRPDMMMWIFAEKILRGEPIPIFNNGEMWRDFTYIDDIVAGILASLDTPPPIQPGISGAVPQRLYNIGNNRPEKLTRVIELLEQACGKRALKEFLPMQPGDVVQTFADLTEIERDLGFAPRTSIEVGVPRFVNWFREYQGM